jgi:hypothetical protein
MEGAFTSYQSFLLKGSTAFFLPPFLPFLGLGRSRHRREGEPAWACRSVQLHLHGQSGQQGHSAPAIGFTHSGGIVTRLLLDPLLLPRTAARVQQWRRPSFRPCTSRRSALGAPADAVEGSRQQKQAGHCHGPTSHAQDQGRRDCAFAVRRPGVLVPNLIMSLTTITCYFTLLCSAQPRPAAWALPARPQALQQAQRPRDRSTRVNVLKSWY